MNKKSPYHNPNAGLASRLSKNRQAKQFNNIHSIKPTFKPITHSGISFQGMGNSSLHPGQHLRNSSIVNQLYSPNAQQGVAVPTILPKKEISHLNRNQLLHPLQSAKKPLSLLSISNAKFNQYQTIEELRSVHSEDDDFLDTHDIEFVKNQYGIFPYPIIASGVAMQAMQLEAAQGAEQALSAYFHVDRANARPHSDVHGTNRVTTTKGIFFDKTTTGLGNAEGYITDEVQTTHKINEAGQEHIDAINKRGKFPFIINLGNGHFVSMVLYKKPGDENPSTGANPWKVAFADSMNPEGGTEISEDMSAILATFVASGTFKDHFGEIDTINDVKYFPCVQQDINNCLLNTYINCRSSQVDQAGNITFPGVDKHPMKKTEVETEVKELRKLANEYTKSSTTVQRKNAITTEWEKFENKHKFQRVLNRLAKDSSIKKHLTIQKIKNIFNDAATHQGVSSIIDDENDRKNAKCHLSRAFQRVAAEEGLFIMKSVTKEVGLRTKLVNQFVKNNGIKLDTALEKAKFNKHLQR